MISPSFCTEDLCSYILFLDALAGFTNIVFLAFLARN